MRRNWIFQSVANIDFLTSTKNSWKTKNAWNQKQLCTLMAATLVSKINTKEKQKRGARYLEYFIILFKIFFFLEEKSSSTFKKIKRGKNLARSKFRTGCVPFRETSKSSGFYGVKLLFPWVGRERIWRGPSETYTPPHNEPRNIWAGNE